MAKALFAAADVALPRLPGPRILIYHQVGSGRGHEMNVSVQTFRRQLDWVQSYGEIVSLEEAIRRWADVNSEYLSVLTFDDGYSDVFLNAFPLMKQRRIPFTLYLTSGPIERPGDFPSWPGEPLGWDQIRSMIDSGLMTVGAHTHTHPDLRFMDDGRIVDELDRSNDLIASRTGAVPRHFTYPKGWWAPQADGHVRARYLSATLGNPISAAWALDVHKINRVPVQRSDLSQLFRMKVRSGGRVEGMMRRRFRGHQLPDGMPVG